MYPAFETSGIGPAPLSGVIAQPDQAMVESSDWNSASCPNPPTGMVSQSTLYYPTPFGLTVFNLGSGQFYGYANTMISRGEVFSALIPISTNPICRYGLSLLQNNSVPTVSQNWQDYYDAFQLAGGGFQQFIQSVTVAAVAPGVAGFAVLFGLYDTQPNPMLVWQTQWHNQGFISPVIETPWLNGDGGGISYPEFSTGWNYVATSDANGSFLFYKWRIDQTTGQGVVLPLQTLRFQNGSTYGMVAGNGVPIKVTPLGFLYRAHQVPNTKNEANSYYFMNPQGTKYWQLSFKLPGYNTGNAFYGDGTQDAAGIFYFHEQLSGTMYTSYTATPLTFGNFPIAPPPLLAQALPAFDGCCVPVKRSTKVSF